MRRVRYSGDSIRATGFSSIHPQSGKRGGREAFPGSSTATTCTCPISLSNPQLASPSPPQTPSKSVLRFSPTCPTTKESSYVSRSRSPVPPPISTCSISHVAETKYLGPMTDAGKLGKMMCRPVMLGWMATELVLVWVVPCMADTGRLKYEASDLKTLRRL
jgi:hypothetical protein